MKRLALILFLISVITMSAFGLSGTYSSNDLFYMPGYGSFGALEFAEYNAYMEIADNAIKDNETAITAIDLSLYYLITETNTLTKWEAIWSKDVTDSDELAAALTDYYLKTAIDTQGEVETIWGVTLATDTELALKANIASPTFTGTVTIPTPFTLGAVSVLPTGTELNFVDGVTSAIQTQFSNKQPLDAQLTDIAALTPTDSNIIVGDGTNFVLESGATARASLGLTIGTNVQAYDAALDSVSALTYVSPSFIKLTADDTYAVRTLTEVKEDLNLEIGTDVLAQQTIGIADDNLVEIDDADAANDDYAKFTANGLEGRSYTEMKTDLAYQLSDLSDVNTSTPTDKFVLVADGTDFESRALTSDDLSDVASVAMLDENETVTGLWSFYGTYVNFSTLNDSPTSPPTFRFRKARDSDGAVLENDELGLFDFYGYVSLLNGYKRAAKIRAVVDGTPGSDDMPGRLEFLTTPDGSSTPILRETIDNAGNIKMGDGTWTNYVNVDSSGNLTFEGTASINEPLSIMAATSSAQLAGVISDEIGAGKARFDTSVTAKTTTATLTEAEAGTILCSAASAYTITLPTAVGNTGLTYHFKKTDANYTLITLDGDGTETINYENSTSAPVLTYNRLNTYCAEVTIVSDGANWQVIDEALGQVPSCWAFLDHSQFNFSSDSDQKVELNAEDFDTGDNFDISTWVSGNCTSTLASHVVDTGGAFNSDMVGKYIKNTTDSTYTYVIAYTSETDITVRDDIFVSGEGYEIKNSKFVAPIPGKYGTNFSIMMLGSSVVIDKRYTGKLRINGASVSQVNSIPAAKEYFTIGASIELPMEKDDYLELTFKQESEVDTVGIYGQIKALTYLQIRLISKD